MYETYPYIAGAAMFIVSMVCFMLVCTGRAEEEPKAVQKTGPATGAVPAAPEAAPAPASNGADSSKEKTE
jgi:hypothetical protein